jgi:hypothetical protein
VTSPTTWDDALDAVLAEMRALMIARQQKYGPQNVRDQGLYGVVTRAVADKVARILTALNGRVVNGRVVLDPIVDAQADDTFEDGCLDASNYLGPIALMVHRGWWELPRKAVTVENVTGVTPNLSTYSSSSSSTSSAARATPRCFRQYTVRDGGYAGWCRLPAGHVGPHE